MCIDISNGSVEQPQAPFHPLLLPRWPRAQAEQGSHGNCFSWNCILLSRGSRGFLVDVNNQLGRGFKYLFFSPLLGEDFQFD